MPGATTRAILAIPSPNKTFGDVEDRDTVPGTPQIGQGQRAIDVACGIGALACAAVRRVGSRKIVVGLDPNDEMLAVARRKSSSRDWRVGRAEALPFKEESFDVVASQFGFMFFEDQPKALAEMIRVLRPEGRLAVAVCDAVDHSPGFIFQPLSSAPPYIHASKTAFLNVQGKASGFEKSAKDFRSVQILRD